MPSSRIVPLPIHPLPARMAPEIALEQVRSLSSEAVILDPMTGSGTVPRIATDHNRRCFGFDTDPRAVLMAQVWTTPIETSELRGTAADVIRQAENLHTGNVTLPGMDEDALTQKYIDYWFGPQQQVVLSRISRVLFDLTGEVADALRIALSRIIVTKNKGASLARDVSHSRPHRVSLESDVDVISGFRLSIERLARRLEEQKPKSNAVICRTDARDLPTLDQTIDAVITSPPYLNAIDYLRGHKLRLVWLGYKLGELAPIRSNNIGAERAPNASADLDLARQLTSTLGALTQLPQRVQRMINRYVLDLHSMISEVYRVLRVGGKAIFVVGNACIKGMFIRNDCAVRAIAERVGLQFEEDTTRDRPPSRRYLPPPTDNQEGSNVENVRIYHLIGRETTCPDSRRTVQFSRQFAQLSPYLVMEVLDLNEAQQQRYQKAYEIAKRLLRELKIFPATTEECGQLLELDAMDTGYPRMTVEHMYDVVRACGDLVAGEKEISEYWSPDCKKERDKILPVLQSLKSALPTNQWSWRIVQGRLSQLLRLKIFDNPKAAPLNCDVLTVPGQGTIIDLSDTDSPQIHNLVIAELLRGLQNAQHENYRRTEEGEAAQRRVMVVIEEAHEFLSTERIKQMPVLFQQVARIARRGRKRWLGLVFVTQLPQHLPDEVLGLINNDILHKIADANVISWLKRSLGIIDDSLWQRLPGLAPGQAPVAMASFARPLLLNINPTPCKLRMVE